MLLKSPFGFVANTRVPSFIAGFLSNTKYRHPVLYLIDLNRQFLISV